MERSATKKTKKQKNKKKKKKREREKKHRGGGGAGSGGGGRSKPHIFFNTATYTSENRTEFLTWTHEGERTLGTLRGERTLEKSTSEMKELEKKKKKKKKKKKNCCKFGQIQIHIKKLMVFEDRLRGITFLRLRFTAIFR